MIECDGDCLNCKYWDHSIPHDSHSESNCCTRGVDNE